MSTMLIKQEDLISSSQGSLTLKMFHINHAFSHHCPED